MTWVSLQTLVTTVTVFVLREGISQSETGNQTRTRYTTYTHRWCLQPLGYRYEVFLPFHYLLNAFKYLQCILPLWNVCNAFHTIWKGTKLEASFLVFLMLLKLPPTTRKVLTGLQIVLTKTQDTQNRIEYSCHKN